MTRRRLLAMAIGATAAWPSAALGQNAGAKRRIAVLMAVTRGDPEGQGRFDALRAGLRERGWIDGQTATLEVHWAGGELSRIRELVAEIVPTNPDIIVGNGTAAASALHDATRTIPVVFVLAADPVGLGYIESLGRPGGNMTGFTFFDPPLVGKWFQLLKEVSPGIVSTSLIFNPGTAGFYYKFFEGLPGLGSQIKLAPVRDMAEVESVLGGLAKSPGSSVIVGADPFNVVHGREIVALAERFRLPAVYIYRQLALDGGLMAYGPDTFDAFYRTADYVDRVLRGTKPADLPAQAPTKYTFVVNMATARKLGLALAPSLLARADEVVE
jgi:putative tryptophan/tyrosine transport system substrate-binding protein